MTFRGYRKSDLDAMCRLDILCFAEPFRFDRITMQDFAEADDAIVILADDEHSHLTGFIILQLEGLAKLLRGYIVTIDVAPGSRRLGTGAALLHQAEAAAHFAGAQSVSLHVSVENHSAIAFYKDQFYLQVGTEKHFYREAGEDALVLARSL